MITVMHVHPSAARLALVALVVLAVLGAGGSALGAGGADGADARIRICHATGNGQWVPIEISVNGLNGHDGHAGDIIPPNDGKVIPEGKNWDETGQDTWANGCTPQTPPTPVHPIGVFVSTVCAVGGGSYAATFGYESENAVEVTVPVGPANRVTPGDADRGQPTSFQPGRVASAFTVAEIPLEVELTWTVTNAGEARSATAGRPTGCDGEVEPPVVPAVSVFVVCVDPGATTYSARFGYANPGSTVVSVAVGSANRFSPGPDDRGQPIAFEPGRDDSALTVAGVPNGTTLVWTLRTNGTRTATAGESFPTRCTPDPPDPPALPVSIFVTCVDPGATSFAARFGYSNPNATPVVIPVGASNRFVPAPADRGQPTAFAPGRTADALTVTGIPNGTDLVWTLNGRTATAGASFPTRCTDGPPDPPPAAQPVEPFVACVVVGPRTIEARFGYRNPNAAVVSIDVGAANRVSPGAEDRGQPTSFRPGTTASAFAVAGVDGTQPVTWSVTSGGESRSARADASSPRCAGAPLPPEVDEPLGIFVACVVRRGERYDAVFGYQNDNRSPVTIPVGAANRFEPAPQGRGQVTTFAPGHVEEAFTVTGISRGTELTWAVAHGGTTRTATASAGFPRACDAPARPTGPIGLTACVVDRGDTFDVRFGYVNENTVAVRVAVGVANAVRPGALDRGQPDLFLPGAQPSAFTVRGVPDGTLVSWTVVYRGVTSALVTASHPVRCAGEAPETPVEVFPLCVLREGKTYTAAFGYANRTGATVRVPRGRSNAVLPKRFDGDQPVDLVPGVQLVAFVAEGVPLDARVTWTLETFGSVDRAEASAALTDCRAIVGRSPRLSLAKRVAPRVVRVGERAEYTLVVRNTGSVAADDVVLVDRPADGRVALLTATASHGACSVRGRGDPGRRVVCRLGRVAPGEAVTVLVAARARRSGVSVNRALVVSVPADGNRRDEVARAWLRIRGPRVESSGAGGPKPSFTG